MVITKQMDTILDYRGYGVLWDDMSDTKQKKHRSQLIFTPKVQGDYASNVQSVPMFRMGRHRMWMPRYYGIRNFGPPKVNNERVGDAVDLEFKGELNDKQKALIGGVIDGMNTKGGGVICLPTGYGKTVVAIYLACHFKKRTLWITHQSNLLEQTKASFENFTNASVGIIKQQRAEVDNPVVIGMLQSISIKTYTPEMFDKFGLVIFDEVHRVPSFVFSKSLWKVNTKYMIGLSATPERKDGMENIINVCLGPIIVRIQEQLKTPVVRWVTAEYEQEPEVLVNSMGKPNIASMTNEVCRDMERNRMIVATILKAVEEGRTILVLTHRRGHAETLAGMLSEVDVGLYLGGMKGEALAVSNTKTVIIGTFSMCAEGYDNKHLNTVMLTTSKRDVRQTVGRVLGLRGSGSLQPMIIDIADTYGVFRGQANARRAYYRKQGFEFEKQCNSSK